MHQVVDEHATDGQGEREAVRLGIWVFLASETLVFAGLALLYVCLRIAHPSACAEASKHLYQSIGIANTGVLLLSSLTMARAARWAGVGDARRAARRLAATAALGALFLAAKGLEYWLDARESVLPGVSFDPLKFEHPAGAERFLSLYVVATGVHAAHLLAGVVVASIASAMLRRGGMRTGAATPVEPIGVYWHFVDAVWLFLLPALYFVT